MSTNATSIPLHEHEAGMASFTVLAIKVRNLHRVEKSNFQASLAAMHSVSEQLSIAIVRHGGMLLVDDIMPCMGIWPSSAPDNRSFAAASCLIETFGRNHEMLELVLALHHGQCLFRMAGDRYREVFGGEVDVVDRLITQAETLRKPLVSSWLPSTIPVGMTVEKVDNLFVFSESHRVLRLDRSEDL